MSDMRGLGETTEKTDDNGNLTSVKAYLAAISRAAEGFKRREGKEPSAVSLPKDASPELVEAVERKGWTVLGKDQSPRQVLVGIGRPWPKPGMWADVPAHADGTPSHLRRVMWSENNLYVHFTDDSMYEYQGFDHLAFRKMMQAESIGGYFTLNVREAYKYRKLSPKEAAALTGGVPPSVKPAQAEAIKPAPGMYVPIEGSDFAYGLEVAIGKGVDGLVEQGVEPNSVALPPDTPTDIVHAIHEMGINLASWQTKRGQVWVGVL